MYSILDTSISGERQSSHGFSAKPRNPILKPYFSRMTWSSHSTIGFVGSFFLTKLVISQGEVVYLMSLTQWSQPKSSSWFPRQFTSQLNVSNGMIIWYPSKWELTVTVRNLGVTYRLKGRTHRPSWSPIDLCSCTCPWQFWIDVRQQGWLAESLWYSCRHLSFLRCCKHR